MRFIVGAVLIGAVFYSGYRLGLSRSSSEPSPQSQVELELRHLTAEELRDYLNLKDQRLKYEKANEILARTMQIFLADLGLRLENQKFNILSESQRRPAEPVEPNPLPTSSSAKPSGDIARPLPPAPKVEKVAATKTDDKPSKPAGYKFVISRKDARGAVHALYQAVLWREPDEGGGASAINRFSAEGWNTYVNNAKAMVRSSEFERDIEANHSAEQIINRIYAVFEGRCANTLELKDHLKALSGPGPQGVVASIIAEARQNNANQIFAGGFNPNSCPN